MAADTHAALAPFAGLFGVVLGSLLNALWQAMRANNERREADAGYRAEVRAHMVEVEKALDGVHKDLAGHREFKGEMQTFCEVAAARLERIETCLGSHNKPHKGKG